MYLPQEDASSPTRYSKTFGREKTLDQLLETKDDKELLAKLAKDDDPVEEKKSNNSSGGSSRIMKEQQPDHTKKL